MSTSFRFLFTALLILTAALTTVAQPRALFGGAKASRRTSIVEEYREAYPRPRPHNQLGKRKSAHRAAVRARRAHRWQ